MGFVNKERYFVELEVFDYGDLKENGDGQKSLLKLRFSMPESDRTGLKQALIQELASHRLDGACGNRVKEF